VGSGQGAEGSGSAQAVVQAGGLVDPQPSQEAEAWLAVLIACLGHGSLPQAVLVLVNDLTQLVYYRVLSPPSAGSTPSKARRPLFQAPGRCAACDILRTLLVDVNFCT
jgi:hypothetical protein